jgi:hypothetical protein
MRQRVIDGLVAAKLEPSLPSALHQHFRRRDQEEQVDILAEPSQ